MVAEPLAQSATRGEHRGMDLPAEVEAAIARATGRAPTSSQHVVAGYTHAEKWRVGLGDATAFVKASADAVAREQIEREAAVIEAIAAPYMPRSYGSARVDEWAVLVLEDLSGAQWPPPYPDEGRGLLETVAQVAATPAPANLSRRPERRPHGTYWQRIAADPEPVLANGSFSAAWLERALPLLEAAESRAQLAGDELVHDDVWAGNVCHTSRGALLIDWAGAHIGDSRIDLAYAVLSIRSAGSPPPQIDFPDEAAYASLLAGANAYQAAQPVNPLIAYGDDLREGWLFDLDFALVWACELLDLPPPKP
jgi:aminoglycoside phosphotransferase (APT) family kinase protein